MGSLLQRGLAFVVVVKVVAQSGESHTISSFLLSYCKQLKRKYRITFLSLLPLSCRLKYIIYFIETYDINHAQTLPHVS